MTTQNCMLYYGLYSDSKLLQISHEVVHETELKNLNWRHYVNIKDLGGNVKPKPAHDLPCNMEKLGLYPFPSRNINMISICDPPPVAFGWKERVEIISDEIECHEIDPVRIFQWCYHHLAKLGFTDSTLFTWGAVLSWLPSSKHWWRRPVWLEDLLEILWHTRCTNPLTNKTIIRVGFEWLVLDPLMGWHLFFRFFFLFQTTKIVGSNNIVLLPWDQTR